IAMTAAINSRHRTEIAHSSLDILHPVAYRVGNVHAATDFRTWLESHQSEVGKDLAALSRDPEFLHALEGNRFYKQTFDEALQLPQRAVIFGFKDNTRSSLRPSQFHLIRFPADLAALLHFQRVD